MVAGRGGCDDAGPDSIARISAAARANGDDACGDDHRDNAKDAAGAYYPRAIISRSLLVAITKLSPVAEKPQARTVES